MKKLTILTILVLCCGMLVAAPSSKKKKSSRREAIHSIYFSGGAGYSSLLGSYRISGINKTPGLAGGLLGAGYELQYRHLHVSVGPEVRILSSTDNIHLQALGSDFPFAVQGTGAVYYPAQTKFYDLHDLHQSQVLTEITIPVLAGGQWDDFYFMGGAKIGYALSDRWRQRGKLTTTLHDPDAESPLWTDVPAHGLYTNADYQNSGRANLGLDVALSAEFGLVLDRFLPENWKKDNAEARHPWHMRVALFADYGLPLSGSGKQTMVTLSETDIATSAIHMSDYRRSGLSTLLVGAKFTALMQLNKIEKKKRTPKPQPSPKPQPAPKPITPVAVPDTVAPAPVPVETEIFEQTEENVYIIHNLMFATGETRILPSSENALEMIYQMLLNRPTVHVRIVGHTDNVGSDRANQILSEGRARSVKEAMVERGIDASRIETEGRGESQPIDTNDTEEGRQRNRRVELEIISE